MGVLSLLGAHIDPVVGVRLQLRSLLPASMLKEGVMSAAALGVPVQLPDETEKVSEPIEDSEHRNIGVRDVEFRLRRIGPVGAFVLGPRAWIDRVDASAALLLGAEDPSELQGRHLSEFVGDPPGMAELRRAITKGSGNMILELRRLDGRTFTAGVSMRLRNRESGLKLIGSVMALA